MIIGLVLILLLVQSQREEELGEEVENLDATEDGEAREESHRAADQTQLGHQGHLRHHTCKRRCYNVEHI